jgi:hypothetical protein
MSRGNKIPFPRGRSAAQGTTIDSGDLQGVHLEGQIVYLPDTDPSDTKKRRSQSDVVAKVVRNVSGESLLPKRLVTYSSGFHGKRVGGYSVEVDQFNIAGVVDDHLPSTGVQNNDLFYVIIGGPVLVTTSASAMTNHASAQGAVVYAQTASNSTGATGTTTAGRITGISATTDQGEDLSHVVTPIGVAKSAIAAGDTAQDKLIDVKLT